MDEKTNYMDFVPEPVRKPSGIIPIIAAASGILLAGCPGCGRNVNSKVGTFVKHRIKESGWPNPWCDQKEVPIDDDNGDGEKVYAGGDEGESAKVD